MPQVIEQNPKILGGQSVIKGTRIPVARILALIGMNYTLAEMKKELPDLENITKKDIVNILLYYQTKIEN